MELKEQALKISQIQTLLSSSKIDIDELKKHCFSKYGLVNDDLRKKAWPLLLNVHVILEEEEKKNHLSESSLSTKTISR